VLMLSDALKNYDCSTLIVAKNSSPLAQRASEHGVPYQELSFRFEADISSARALAQIGSENVQTIYHAHTPHALGQAILAQNLGTKHPIVFTRRVTFPLKKLAVTRWKLHQADRIIAVSHAVAAELRKGGIDSERIHVIHSAVDIEAFPYRGPSL